MRSLRLPAVIWGACLLLIVVTLAVAACSGSACAATWLPDRGGSGGFGYSGGGKGGTTGTSSGSKGGGTPSSGSKGSGTSGGGGRSYPPPRLTTITYLSAPAAGTYHYRIAAEGMPMRSVGPNVYYQYNGGWYPGYMYGGYFYLYDADGDC